MRSKCWVTLAGAGLLASCGGGGGGSVNVTPTPPPVSTSTSFSDLRGTTTFAGDSATSSLTFNLTSRTAASGTAGRGTLTVSYNANAKTYTLAAPGRSQTFASGDIQAATDTTQVRYMKTDGTTRDFLTLVNVPYTGQTAGQYVRLGFWQRNTSANDVQSTLFDTFTYGFDTPSAAIPRTGSASFGIDVFGLATTIGAEPYTFQGHGTFDTDFAAGIFSTNTSLTETGLLSGTPLIGGALGLTGGGRLSASDGTFSGNVFYNGGRTSLAGTLAGRFYGPAAEELGASFSGSNADGRTLTGSFTGVRDAANPAVNLTLTNIVTAQRFFADAQLLTLTANDVQVPSTVRTGPLTAQLNDQTGGNLFFSPGISNLQSGAFTAAAIVTSIDPNFTRYEKTFTDRPVILELYKSGSGNRELSLTYSSFGRWSNVSKVGTVTDDSREFFYYGLATPAGLLSAKTGSASYAGVVYGAGANETTQARYDINGTSRFDVNFTSQSYSGALSLKGTSTNGAAAVDFGAYDFTGNLVSTQSSSAAATTLTQNGRMSGDLKTRFYGPDGEEIGGPFALLVQDGNAGAGTRIVGVAAARRQ